MQWLRSGLRRDLCVLLAGADGRRGQQLKTDLHAHYDGRVPPRQFREALDALVEAGHVERRSEGVHDVYSLTDAGEQALDAHVEWLCERIDGAE